MKTLQAVLAASASAFLCGCVAMFEMFPSVGTAKSWAQGRARSLSASLPARTPLPPKDRSFLIGTWHTKVKILSMNAHQGSRYVSATVNSGDWHDMDVTYRFQENGNYVSDIVSSSKFGSFTVHDTKSSVRGTWSYENGTMTMRSSQPIVGLVEQRYNVLWYSDDEWELREEDKSLQEARSRLERALRGVDSTISVRSFGQTRSDKGVTATWSEMAGRQLGASITAGVSPPSILKRGANEPRVPAPARPAAVASAPAVAAPPPSAKWTLVERTDIGDDKTRYVFDLSEGVSVEEADRGLLPWVCGRQKDAFLRKNPDVDPGSVRATADFETRNGRRTLVYTASAFTTQPTCLEMDYDAMSRRGTVSYRIHAYGDVEAAYDFVRRNIGSLLSGENVVLEAGKEPPPGAKFRLENQLFQDGVLTVEFEALE